MLKIHVKLLAKIRSIALRDMEVGMVYRGYKGVPKIIVHKTNRSIVVRNLGEEKTHTSSTVRTATTRAFQVFAIAKNDQRDIDALVSKTPAK